MILTPFEVVVYSPAGRDYPQGVIAQILPDIEAEIGYSCLGEKLYKWLLANLTPTPVSVMPFNPNTKCCFDTNEATERNGIIYVSLVNMNCEDPAKGDTSIWRLLKKFTNEQANTFYETYLRKLIAYRVYAASIDLVTYQSGAKGLTVNVGDDRGNRAVDKSELNSTKTNILSLCELFTENMRRFLRVEYEKQDNTLPLDDLFKNCASSACDLSVNKGKRRISFLY